MHNHRINQPTNFLVVYVLGRLKETLIFLAPTGAQEVHHTAVETYITLSYF